MALAVKPAGVSHAYACLRALEGLIDERMNEDGGIDAATVAEVRALIGSGVGVDDGWAQVGVHPAGARRRELYVRIAGFARELLGAGGAEELFFMHKPPGLRLRFKGAPAGVVDAEVARWRRDGLVDGVEPGVYEPEERLFGGPRSMTFAHTLFTIDSLVWLDFHALSEQQPAWLLSLAMLRPVFEGLGVVGWEDIGVWDGVRRHAGRRLPEHAVAPEYVNVARSLRAVWADPGAVVDPGVAEILEPYAGALRAAASGWRAGYFGRRGAELGPRAALAVHVVFHWNRGALSGGLQALLAESLAERIGDDGR
ncbi:MAG TPA: thiopeptide-type bacteriocin biosynthesis protein [Solirubrobacter sp.]|nr:thiopeptide-type bacteriocin biosynthesis protein [Solirubrobacter sp.]